MQGLGLLVGHLIGDFLVQNDFLAGNKTNPHPGKWWGNASGQPTEWDVAYQAWLKGHLACTVHCLLYTLAVWLCSFRWMPWWGLFICFLAHWPIDRFRLASWWMQNVSGQKVFLEKMAPWSVIVVDNTFHLLTLYSIGCLAT